MQDHLYALPEGTILEGYRIERVLGVGGFGITYFARDTDELGKCFAIKEYMPNEFSVRVDDNSVLPKSSNDKEEFDWGLERFLDEAKTLATFSHPHLNAVFRFFRSNGTAYMVLEYIEGETLSAKLKRDKQLSESELTNLLRALTSGLEVVHREGFVHRDIKPGNIMIKPDGSPILLDFGAARAAIGKRSESITTILTPGYAPVEQYTQVVDDIGPWTDIYSLGMVAYRCVSGQSDRDLIDAIARARLHKKKQFDEDMKPAVDIGKGMYNHDLLESIDWAIMVDEGDRPQSVGNWSEALFGSIKDNTINNAQPGKTAIHSSKKMIIASVVVVCVGVIMTGTWLSQRSPVSEEVVSKKRELLPIQSIQSKPVMSKLSYEPVMIVIPAGRMQMGDLNDTGRSEEKPVHLVTINSFAMSKYEVTFAEYDKFAEATGNNKPKDEGWDRGNKPVINVSWNDATRYAKWLSNKTGKKYRLPSEAEWEYAARAGSTTDYPWGNAASHDYANYGKEKCCGGLVSGRDQWENSAPVGSFPANKFGLHDMHGNVWEWTQDCWNQSYEGAPVNGIAWASGDCERRVYRGGGWYLMPKFMRSAFRLKNTPDTRSHNQGFRLVHDL